MSRTNTKNFLMQDVAIVAFSIIIALVMTKTNLLSGLLASTESLKYLGSFVAGIFFTSIFTTAPAIVTLGEIAQSNSLFFTAIFGALGAVIGDVIIFRFIRDRLSEHLLELVKHDTASKRVKALLKLRYFRWFTFFAGGLIIASPLPDEIGIGLLGFSKMKIKTFVPISFIFNFLGILIIGLLARTI
jgi:hypothetical protein